MPNVALSRSCLLLALAGSCWSSPIQADQSLTLNWDPSTDAGVVQYNLYYGEVGVSTNKLVVGTVTTATVTGLVAGKDYFFYGTAVDSHGEESRPSNWVTYAVGTGPQFSPIASQTVAEGALLSVSLTATDSDPAAVLRYSLLSGPAGAVLDPVSGVFRWTPSEAQGPSSNSVTVQVSDGSATDTTSFVVTVTEVNTAPLLDAVPSQTIAEGSTLRVALAATDRDLPLNVLTYGLVSGPAGATVDPATGVFSWTPSEAQGPASVIITVQVSDGAGGVAIQRFTVNVSEVNRPPVLNPIPDQKVNAGQTLTLTLVATDPDVPANKLTYRLVSGPATATVDPSTGVFTWRPSKNEPTRTVAVTVSVADDGSPSGSDAKMFNIAVSGKGARNFQTAAGLTDVPFVQWTVSSGGTNSLRFVRPLSPASSSPSSKQYLERSADLVTWKEVGEISPASELHLEASGVAHQFYRVRTEAPLASGTESDSR